MDENTDYATTLLIVSWALGAIVILVCTLRVYGRVVIINQAGWDDGFMVFGALSAIVCSALVTAGVSHGLGRHREQITDPVDLQESIKYTIIAPLFSIISSTCSKISILIFLVRLMGMTAKHWHLIFLWGLCVLLVLLNIFAIVVIIRFCDPPAKQWNPDLEGTCIDPRIQLYGGAVQASYNALMDIIVAIFPTMFITKLNITRKMKVGLSFLMGGGVFAAAATITKVYLIKDLDKHSDITWFWAPITLWYTAEMDVIIIVGTVPALWPLFKMCRARGGGSSGYGPYKNASSNPGHAEGSEAYQLSSSKRQGPVTRALQEVDDLDINTRSHDSL